MKLVLRTLLFHLICIITFGVIYWMMSNHFSLVLNGDNPKLIDFIFLSTTVQAGVGLSDLNPLTTLSKLVLIIQQFIMISTNVFLFYIFTL
jgi:hypothetical protein